MSQEEKDFFIEFLNQKVYSPCPRCENTNFTFLGETQLFIDRNPKDFEINGPATPSIMIYCVYCGGINFYVKNVLQNIKEDQNFKKNNYYRRNMNDFIFYCLRCIIFSCSLVLLLCCFVVAIKVMY